MSNTQEVYDIQLSLTRGEADLLLDALEAYGLEAHNSAAYTGSTDELKVVDSVDNIVSMITLCVVEQEPSVEEGIDFQNKSKWLYHKGG
ncbi:hypothetical protein CMI47_21640 [Candidatus Pacearchaeota archaeon]|nr:hypothetical protein [Candidatus Pacearchaeota archaeon]|tara:strand:- start:55 stop:321 length:267 start_codon:yes stop_codon:yes gene_type:complete